MTPALVAVAAAARAGGWVVAAGSLAGIGDASVVWVASAIALIGFGRALTSTAGARWVPVAAVGVMAAALAASALRWSALDLASIRGAQSVIGPTVGVGNLGAAAGASLALAAVVFSGAVFSRRQEGWLSLAADALLVGLAAVALFVAPASSGDWAATAAIWAASAVGMGALVGTIAWALERWDRWVPALVAVAGLCAVIGVGWTAVG